MTTSRTEAAGFAVKNGRAPAYECLYADMVGDLFHFGHVNLLSRARSLCERLIVGVHNDADVATYKRTPVMTMDERIAVVEACRWVDRVIPDAPLTPTVAFLDSLGAAKVVHGDDFSPELLDYCYGELRAADRLILLPHTPKVTTSSVIRRITTRLADGDL